MVTLKYTFCFPIVFSIETDEYTSWRDIQTKICHEHNILPIDIEYIIYNNRIQSINDDFINIDSSMNNELRIVLSSYTYCRRMIDRLVSLYSISNILRTFYEYYLSQEEGERAEGSSTSVPKMTEIEISRLKHDILDNINYSYGEKYKECPISKLEIENTTPLIQLDCSHYFIESYIKEWLLKYSSKCPLCRK